MALSDPIFTAPNPTVNGVESASSFLMKNGSNPGTKLAEEVESAAIAADSASILSASHNWLHPVELRTDK